MGVRRRIIGPVTAFTVAHSVTLALSVLGVVTLRQAPVEVLVAASVVLLAVEAARSPGAGSTWTGRYPEAAAFAFGLLHGLGFAGALREVGLPEDALPAALFGFNAGIEIGQLAFVAVAASALVGLRRWLRGRERLALAYAMGCPASWWTLQRLAAL